VLKRIQAWVGMNKLSPTWEGPYCVVDVSRQLRTPSHGER